MTKVVISTSSSKCGSSKKNVKDGDKSGIVCDNCSPWYNGTCKRLSEEDIKLMVRIKGCSWLRDSWLNDDIFNPKPEYNHTIDAKQLVWNPFNVPHLKSKKLSHNTNSRTCQKRVNGESLPREIILKVLLRIKEFSIHLLKLTTLNYRKRQYWSKWTKNSQKRLYARLCQSKADMSTPNPLLVRFTSARDARKVKTIMK